MKTLIDQLSNYASYHRDPRNIGTHFVGVPMIVVAVSVLLSRPALELGGITLSPALVGAVLLALYYLRLARGLGLLMTALLAACVVVGAWAAALDTAAWLGTGIGLFVVGWIIQFIGHFWEGRKPAFVDDIMGLFIGPLFVVAEALFLLGLLAEVRAAVESRAGPVRRRPADSAARA